MNKKHVILGFNLTGKCNLQCPYCAVDGGRKDTPDLTLKTVKKAIEKVKNWHPGSCLDVNLHADGEPLLNPNISEICATIDNMSQKIRMRRFLTTNGTKEIHALALKLAERGWIITISHDGVAQEANRGYKSLMAEELIQEMSKRRGNQFIVRATLTPEWMSKLGDSIKLWKTLGAKFVMISPVFPLGRQKNEVFFRKDDFLDAVIIAKRAGIKLLVSTNEPCMIATQGYYFSEKQISICYSDYFPPTQKNRIFANKHGCLVRPDIQKRIFI